MCPVSPNGQDLLRVNGQVFRRSDGQVFLRSSSQVILRLNGQVLSTTTFGIMALSSNRASSGRSGLPGLFSHIEPVVPNIVGTLWIPVTCSDIVGDSVLFIWTCLISSLVSGSSGIGMLSSEESGLAGLLLQNEDVVPKVVGTIILTPVWCLDGVGGTILFSWICLISLLVSSSSRFRVHRVFKHQDLRNYNVQMINTKH